MKLNVEELLQTKAYDFLRTNEHLKGKILFLCLGGSHSYGTNIETSDVDIRGVALDSKEDIIGITKFEQFLDEKTDTCIYSLSKFIQLVSNCNPNIIEMLFCKPEHYFWVSDAGRMILENRHLFLSKRAYHTFSGYAHAQLNKIENALARDENVQPEKDRLEHINRSIANVRSSLANKFNLPENKVNTYVGQYGDKPEILIDLDLKGYPLSRLKSSVEEMTNVLRDYSKSIGHRNQKKDDLHLNKHMMHLIRLYLMGNEILKTCDLHTFRTEDHDLLMAIRNGEYRTKDSGIKDEFYEMLSKLESDAYELYKTSLLPKVVNKNKISKLMLEIYQKFLFNIED